MNRLGVDIGGTFTDLLVVDEASGALRWRRKVPTTPSDPSEGALNGIALLNHEAPGLELSWVCHATTVITNALLERRTARVGLITTSGFRDVLELARMVRGDLYDLDVERLPALVTRDRVEEIGERVRSDGRVHRTLDLSEVDAALDRLMAKGIDCLAICLINSYANPDHERRIAARARERLPGVALCTSSDLVPEFREYRRFSSTAVNAATLPIFSTYVRRMQDRLREVGIPAPLYLMQSNGGMVSADESADRPIAFVESGPAAGVVACAALAQRSALPAVLAFDMGGTTAKVGMVRDGTPSVASEYTVGGPRHGRTVGAAGAGYPIRMPVIDLVEVGAGGGSIAWVDAGGRLRVGPTSAGADPGPMCYDAGGTAPTLTDAHVVTGIIDPERFLGGTASLRADLAFEGIAALGDQIGSDPVATAQGIIALADAAVLSALRVVSVERGIDPRGFTLVAFGGAGPMRGATLAAALDMEAAVIPPEPGLFSALGLLLSDIRVERIRSLVQPLASVDAATLNGVVHELRDDVDRSLADEGVAPDRRAVHLELDLRYHGQSHELTVPVPAGIQQERLKEVAADSFHDCHAARYGYAAREASIDLVAVRVAGVGLVPPVARVTADRGDGDPSPARCGSRRVHLDRGDPVDAAVFDRARLRFGDRFPGPALVEQYDSTIVVPTGHDAEIDQHLNLIIRCPGSPIGGDSRHGAQDQRIT